MRAILAAFLFGAIYEWVVVSYYLAIGSRHALQAGIISTELGFLAIGTLWAWEVSGRRFRVLAAEAVGMGVGSWAAVHWGTP